MKKIYLAEAPIALQDDGTPTTVLKFFTALKEARDWMVKTSDDSLHYICIGRVIRVPEEKRPLFTETYGYITSTPNLKEFEEVQWYEDW